MAKSTNWTLSDLNKKGLNHNFEKKDVCVYSSAAGNPDVVVSDDFVTIELVLLGVPMPKQSVRGTKDGHYFQPQKTIDRKKDYIKQVLGQLPKGFKPFEKEVHILKFHCIYPPLKKFSTIKGMMERLRNGEKIYKTTAGDLQDNLKKLPIDSLLGIVLRDDSIICTENDTAKYYGLGGAILITLKGK